MFGDSLWVDRAVKLAVLAALSPLWWPVAKAMFNEFRTSLIPEGGLFGRKPSALELERAMAERGDFDPLVSEPWADNLVPRAGSKERSGETTGVRSRGARTGVRRAGAQR